MMDITIKQLRYFEAVASQGHFGRAADICAISQPAISVQIQNLEESLGGTLFERSPRNVRLTTLGEDFAKRVRGILQSIDDLSELGRMGQKAFGGRLRFGVIPTIAPYLLPSIVENLGDAFPDLDLHIRETLTETLIAELHVGKLDVALVALPISEPDLIEIPLFDEAFVLVRHKNDAELPVPDAAGLHKLRLLLLEEGHCFRDQALSFCGLRNNLPREGMEGSSLATLVQMVGSGIGVTLIPDMAVSVETRAANVAVSRFPDPVPQRSIGLVWRKTNPLAHQLTKLAEIVRKSTHSVHN